MHFKSLCISVVVIIIFFRVPTCELCTYLFYVAFFLCFIRLTDCFNLEFARHVLCGIPGLCPTWMYATMCCFSSRAVPRLLWAPRKMCRPTVFEWLWMKCICPCFTPPWIALVENARETVSHPWLAMLSNFCFSLEQEALQHSHYMIWQFFHVERAKLQ